MKIKYFDWACAPQANIILCNLCVKGKLHCFYTSKCCVEGLSEVLDVFLKAVHSAVLLTWRSSSIKIDALLFLFLAFFHRIIHWNCKLLHTLQVQSRTQMCYASSCWCSLQPILFYFLYLVVFSSNERDHMKQFITGLYPEPQTASYNISHIRSKTPMNRLWCVKPTELHFIRI